MTDLTKALARPWKLANAFDGPEAFDEGEPSIRLPQTVVARMAETFVASYGPALANAARRAYRAGRDDAALEDAPPLDETADACADAVYGLLERIIEANLPAPGEPGGAVLH